MPEQVSLIKALQTFMSTGSHGRKVEITEFKALNYQDRQELRDMLIAEGFDVAPLKGEVFSKS